MTESVPRMEHRPKIVVETESGLFRWCCNCGQASADPQTSEVCNQQMERHVAEWEAYYDMFDPIDPTACPLCKVKFGVGDALTEVDGRNHHSYCANIVRYQSKGGPQ